MKKWMWMMAVMLAGSLALTGCSSDSDDDDDAADAAEPPAAAPAAEAEDDAPSANEQFAGITPSGLALTEKFSIVGRGMVYQVRCDAVAGAASYTFTTSFGGSETVAANNVALNKTGADESFTLSVYATNAEGINTRTASAAVN
ncbi:MAG: hypothetical protein GX548_04025 [Lentisphaerae bacterium]|nr:hypothetical protein [Lentisphaerota bacterium]